MPAKIDRKILQSGSSKVAALPPDWLRAFKLEVGDQIEIFYDSVVIVKPKGLKVDPNFLVKEFKLMAELEEEATTKQGG
ncbi:MAG: AbrB/MazE/SpoVT family DNA-binding domain-containing protein [Candidatus Freyarchaeota archaeon]